MIQIKEILIPTDFSDTSSPALGHASMMAERFKAHLTMLHVAGSSKPVDENAFPVVDPETDDLTREAEEEVSELAGLEPPQNLQVKRVVRRSDNPAEEITRYAREHNVDLIVIGTHGRTGLSHLIMGSVAESVIRSASCPVITVRKSDTAAQVMPYLKILAPIDFSPNAEKALTYAWTLARVFHAGLQLLHVVDLPVHPEHYAVNTDLNEQIGHELALRSHRELARLVSDFPGPPVSFETFVESGRAYSEIVDFASASDTDLIVMGTHGLSGLQRFLVGGTTARVVRHAPCPVLTVKLKERDFVELPQDLPPAA